MRHRLATTVALCWVSTSCTDPPKGLPLVAPETDAPTEDVHDTADTDDTHTPDTADSADSGDTGEVLPPWDDGPPPVVVLFIGDGMGANHVRGSGLMFHGAPGTMFMETAPHIGWLQTASMSGYTDSAASATTMATGIKTSNGRIGKDVHGHDIAGLVDIARLRGLSVGVVTTDTLTGATPSSFFAHADNRYDTDVIADGLAADPPDVMLGGGMDVLGERFDPELVTFVDSSEALAAAPVDPDVPLVGLFAGDELPIIVDMEEGDPTPRLPELVSAALDHLLTDPDGALLIVEGARIDHASHANRTDAVFYEVREFDQAIQATVERLSVLEDNAVTVVVTADHECGGLDFRSDDLDTETGLPDVRWLWTDHTNRDVRVFGWGDAAAPLAGDRKHNNWVWATLDGALRSRDPVTPDLPRIADGLLDDLGAPLVTQTIETNFGDGFNQLDALRVTSDESGLWVGVDGVFDERANAVVVWLDLDHGAGTGVGMGLELDDVVGVLDRIISTPTVVSRVPGVGFDAAVAQVGASYARRTATRDTAGVRQFQSPRGEPDDLAWYYGIVNYDDGNVADGEPAPDANSMGNTQNGMEVFVGYGAFFEEGLPEEGADIALVVTLISGDALTLSTQALPPQDIRGDDGVLEVSSVVALSVDRYGNLTDGPRVVP